MTSAPKSGQVLTSAEKRTKLQAHIRLAMSRARLRRRQVFLDLYGGTGGVTASLRRAGFGVLTFDLDLGAEFDLADPTVVNLIIGWLDSGVVLGIMLAPPCGSWSRALTMWGHAVRSREKIYGLDGLAPHRDLIRLLGNITMRSAYKIARRAVGGNIPVVLEQPCGSLMLETPEHKRLAKHASFRHIHLDQCQFGARWRKRTALCFWNTVSPDVVDVRCQGHGGLCDQTHKYHIHLQGKAPGGRNWTSIAQHYPKRLCNAIGRLLVSSADAAIHAARKSLVA